MPPPLALEPHVAQLCAIAELMLGAAHADGEVTWAERGAIGKAMADFVGTGQLPDAVRDCIQDFDPVGFDPQQAVSRLTLKTARDRKELLALVSRVVDADAELLPDEAGYLRRVATIIGATPAELAEFLEPD